MRLVSLTEILSFQNNEISSHKSVPSVQQLQSLEKEVTLSKLYFFKVFFLWRASTIISLNKDCSNYSKLWYVKKKNHSKLFIVALQLQDTTFRVADICIVLIFFPRLSYCSPLPPGCGSISPKEDNKVWPWLLSCVKMQFDLSSPI